MYGELIKLVKTAESSHLKRNFYDHQLKQENKLITMFCLILSSQYLLLKKMNKEKI